MTDRPTAAEFRDYLRQHNLSGTKVFEITGVKPRTVRRMCLPENRSGHKRVPAAVWYMLQDKVSKGEHLNA